MLRFQDSLALKSVEECLDDQNINTGHVRRDPELGCNGSVISIRHSSTDALMLGRVSVMEVKEERKRSSYQKNTSILSLVDYFYI